MKSIEEIKKMSNLAIFDTASDGGNGMLYKNGKVWATVIWSNGGGWEHVSVSPVNKREIPTWDDMCKLKDKFFNDDEWVVQFHPAKADYVDNMSNCLHLWKPINKELPTPPSYMVGLKKGQTYGDVINEMKMDGVLW